MAEYAHGPSLIKKNEIHGSALSLLEYLAHYGGKKKSVSWHFTFEQLVFRASQEKQKKIPEFPSLSKETKNEEKKDKKMLLVPVLKLLLIIFCYQFFYMCQFVV